MKTKGKKISAFLGSTNVAIFVLIALCAGLAVASPAFLSVNNIMNTVRQVSMLGIVGCGVTVVMITGNMDISAGYQIGLAGVIAAYCMVRLNLPIVLSIIITMLCGMACGFLNGFLSVKTKLSPFIITLGTMQIFQSVSFIISGGVPISSLPSAYKVLGQGYVSFIPLPVIILLIVAVITWITLTKTSIGRYVYAMGGNVEATRLAGVNTSKMTIFVYTVSGVACALAGIIYSARVNSGIPGAGDTYTFDVITANVLGGVSLAGGKGSIFGTMVGVLVIGVLANGLVLLDINEYWQMAIKGFVLLLAVSIDAYKQVADAKRASKDRT